MNTYLEGTLVSLTIAVTNAAGAATNPTGVTLIVENPQATKVTYTYGSGGQIAFTAPATYSADIDTTGEPGLWYYRWNTAGAQAVAEGSFNVAATTP